MPLVIANLKNLMLIVSRFYEILSKVYVIDRISYAKAKVMVQQPLLHNTDASS
jgi:predicted ATP-grasp superfamily ATP-dependent carboligase